ncbi:MAG: sugar phosphate nucleotidyltransferase, partial [Bradyrhizobium sp.]
MCRTRGAAEVLADTDADKARLQGPESMKSWRKAIVGTDATVSEAIAAIESGSIQVALVLDGSGRLVGVITDGDIRRGLLRGMQLSGLATDVVNRSAVSAPATLSRDERLHLMRQRSIKQLPLLDGNGQLVGVETFDELIEAPHYPNPVLIMAGGLGERLGALTRERPKPMLNVGGRPLLETIIRNVVQQGFRNIFISVNYMADMIVEHFGDGSAFGATVQY